MTDWLPEDRDRRIWVLDNDEVIEAPETEISSAGRRVRIKDRPETSVWNKDRDAVIQEAIQRAVHQRGASILACTKRSRALSKEQDELSVPKITDSDDNLATIKLSWIFRHPTAPLYASVNVVMERRYGRYKYEVKTRLTFDEISHRGTLDPHIGSAGDGSWSVGSSDHYWTDSEKRKREQLSNAKITPHLDTQTFTSERDALAALRKKIDTFESQISIPIPDARHEDITWIHYTFLRSNIHGEFIDALNTYLDSESAIIMASDAYNKLRDALKSLGITIGAKTQDDFARALSSPGEALIIDLPTQNQGDAGNDHSVVLHLATGTIAVACDNDTNPKQTADEWTLARFEAEMRGELDAFLAFHGNGRERQTNRIIRIARDRHERS